MTRTNQSFTMYSQNSQAIYISVKDKQNKPVPIDAGDTFKWVMMLRGKTIAFKESGTGISVIDATLGRVCVRLLPDDTKGISGECDHELKMLDSDGSATTVTTGKVTIIKSLLDTL